MTILNNDKGIKGLSAYQRRRVLHFKGEIQNAIIMARNLHQGDAEAAFADLHESLHAFNSYKIADGKYTGWYAFNFQYGVVYSTMMFNRDTSEIRLKATCNVIYGLFVLGSEAILQDYKW